MDFITHLPPSSGKTTILVVVDRLSKYAHFTALGPSFTAHQVAAVFLREIIRLHGVPTNILSDRDPLFMSSFWQELFELQGTILSMTSAYHPQSDCQTEVVNRCLEDYLRCYVADQPKQWTQYLPLAEWHYNTSWHSSIQMSPFEAVYGRPPPSLLDYVESSAKLATVDELLTTRTDLMRQLRHNLLRACATKRTLAAPMYPFRSATGYSSSSNLFGRSPFLPTKKLTNYPAVSMVRSKLQRK